MTEEWWPLDYQTIFWQAYPRRLDKKKAMQKLEIIRKSGVPFSDIISGVEGYARYVQGTEPQFIKHPTTFLNGRCWENEYPKPARSGETAFVAGVANVAARYGVTAGVRINPDTPKPTFVNIAAAGVDRRPPDSIEWTDHGFFTQQHPDSK